MSTNRDNKRTPESKMQTQAIRTERRNRRTEQKFTARSFERLIARGL